MPEPIVFTAAAQISTPRPAELERIEFAHLPAVATSRLKIAMDVPLAAVASIVLLPSLLLIGLLVCIDIDGRRTVDGSQPRFTD